MLASIASDLIDALSVCGLNDSITLSIIQVAHSQNYVCVCVCEGLTATMNFRYGYSVTQSAFHLRHKYRFDVTRVNHTHTYICAITAHTTAFITSHIEHALLPKT